MGLPTSRTREHPVRTVVLSNYALADALALLIRRYEGQAVVTTEVLAEVASGILVGYDSLSGVDHMVRRGTFQSVSLTEVERARLPELRRSLGLGEASCLAYATGRDAVVVTDDRVARQTCERGKIRCTGTIGILPAACRDADLSMVEVQQVLDRMKGAGYYCPINRLADLL